MLDDRKRAKLDLMTAVRRGQSAGKRQILIDACLEMQASRAADLAILQNDPELDASVRDVAGKSIVSMQLAGGLPHLRDRIGSGRRGVSAVQRPPGLP